MRVPSIWQVALGPELGPAARSHLEVSGRKAPMEMSRLPAVWLADGETVAADVVIASPFEFSPRLEGRMPILWTPRD
jgi:hypothetical protein